MAVAEGGKPAYAADSMQVLEGREAVRKRPTMYVGSTGGEGVLACLKEVVDNAVDEHLSGTCQSIEVFLDYSKGFMAVVDDGRGIPAGVNKDTGLTGVQIAATALHGGAKFDKGSYQISGGLNGVGLSVVNFLSEKMEINVANADDPGRAHAYIWRKGIEFGTPVAVKNDGGSFTEVGFILDKDIFKPDGDGLVMPEMADVADMLRHRSYVFKGLRCRLAVLDRDGRDVLNEEYYAENGISDYVADMASGSKDMLCPVAKGSAEEAGVSVEVAWTLALDKDGDYDPVEMAFCNGIWNHEGGSHLTGMRRGLTGAFMKYVEGEGSRHLGVKDRDLKLTGDDVREGVLAVVSVLHPDPEFVGNRKAELGNRDVGPLVGKAARMSFEDLVRADPKAGRAVVRNAVAAARSREASKRSRRASQKVDRDALSLAVAGKLAGCESNDPSERELVIVEGDSAGGSAKNARDVRTQAIFPLKGKLLNTYGKTMEKALRNSEIRDLANVLGCGKDGTLKDENLAYHKIIWCPDADYDGQHIGALGLTLMIRHFPDIVKAGRVFVACPPLFSVGMGGRKFHCADDLELQTLVAMQAKKKYLFDHVLENGAVEMCGMDRIRRILDAMERYVDVMATSVDSFRIPPLVLEDAFGNFEGAWRKYEFERIDEKGMFVRFMWRNNRHSVWMPHLRKVLDDMKDFSATGHSAFLVDIEVRVAETRENAFPNGSRFDFYRRVLKDAMKGMEVTYLKGLGEMDPDEFWETTMDPKRRRLIKVTMDDPEQADETCRKLMDKGVELSSDRRGLILDRMGDLSIRDLDIHG